MQRELCAVLDEVDANPEIRVVVVTGRGRGFCAGADLGGGGDSFDVGAGSPATGGGSGPHRDEGGLLTLRIFQCTKPVIAAINGPAVGVGATMTLPMDIRLASESARFGFVFARRGLVPEACSSWFLPRAVGINTALEWTITGRVFDAQEALDRGLVRSDPRPGRPAARGLRAGRRDRLHHLGDVGGHDPPDAVADARGVAPDGRAPRRLAGHRVARPLRGRARRA